MMSVVSGRSPSRLGVRTGSGVVEVLVEELERNQYEATRGRGGPAYVVGWLGDVAEGYRD